jgi:hypothetical protein
MKKKFVVEFEFDELEQKMLESYPDSLDYNGEHYSSDAVFDVAHEAMRKVIEAVRGA